MNIIYAILLGIVQGLTEFLPVSSSGHLVLFQKIFGITAPALFFDIMLHAGTLIAVFAVFWRDIMEILKKPIQPLTGFLLIATIPAVIAALFFGDAIEHAFESGQFLGICFLLTSAFLFFSETVSKRCDSESMIKDPQKMKLEDALFIGLMQAFAIAPGISRSGATISGALSRKLSRDFAARFSFLMSIPVILGALVMQIKDLLKGSLVKGSAPANTAEYIEAAVSAAPTGASADIGTAAVIAGTISAAVVGFFAIKLMLKLIREKSLYGFAIYTASLGLLILIDQSAAHFVF